MIKRGLKQAENLKKMICNKKKDKSNMETTSNFHQNNHLQCIKMLSESMEGTIAPGEILTIDVKAEINNGNVVAAKLKNGTSIVSRFMNLGNEKVKFYYDNNTFAPITVNSDQIESISRVIYRHVDV